MSTAAPPPQQPPPPPPPPKLDPAEVKRREEFLRKNNELMKAFPVKGAPDYSSSRGGRTRRRFKKHRLMSRKYCKKTPCRRMGFTQKASCRPYKNCYK
jgi:hypothetical protein